MFSSSCRPKLRQTGQNRQHNCFPPALIGELFAGDVAISSAPSKRTALYSPAADAIIARSDSNAEDLEGFAGAGLYDSVIVGASEAALEVTSAIRHCRPWDIFVNTVANRNAKVWRGATENGP
jgi:hypothetical protein